MSGTIPLRTLLIGSLLGLVVVPVGAATGVWFGVAHAQQARLDERLTRGVSAIRAFAANPSTAASRRRLDERLASLGVGAVVSELGADKRPLFTSSTLRLNTPAEKLQQRAVLPSRSYAIATAAGSSGSIAAQVEYRPLDRSARWLWASVAALVGALCALVCVFALAGRWLVAPLRSLSDAVDRFAGGVSEPVALPKSRVRESANVAEAVRGMGVALGQAEQERRFLISAIAHDLRTPLFALRSYLAGIRQGLGSGDDYLGRAEEKAAQLERLISDLFAFTRAEYAREPPRTASVDLAELLRRGAEGFEQLASSKDMTISCAQLERAHAAADPHLIERVIANLLDNAVRHCGTGATISLACGKTAEEAWFSVADDGAGIPARALARVFDPFYRVDESRNSAHGGAGLGLAIARRLVEAHGGRLTARNTNGAVFTAYLPSATSDAAAPLAG